MVEVSILSKKTLATQTGETLPIFQLAASTQ